MVKIINELLINKKQYVKINGALSLSIDITIDVPQGLPISHCFVY